jgi:hypothetical protein
MSSRASSLGTPDIQPSPTPLDAKAVCTNHMSSRATQDSGIELRTRRGRNAPSLRRVQRPSGDRAVCSGSQGPTSAGGCFIRRLTSCHRGRCARSPPGCPFWRPMNESTEPLNGFQINCSTAARGLTRPFPLLRNSVSPSRDAHGNTRARPSPTARRPSMAIDLCRTLARSSAFPCRRQG